MHLRSPFAVAIALVLVCISELSWAQSQAKRNLALSRTEAAASEKRVALVIGNSAYKSSPLKNPANDARDMAVKLRTLGFEVIERANLNVRQIGGTLREFRSKLAPGAVALVFYAGHGLQIKGDNYLPAVDADIGGEEDVPNQSLAVKQLMDVLDDAKTRLNLVFLDACRNNPYARSFRSAASGLAKVSAPSGTLISFATRPGSVAADGYGRNGLYTSQLLQQMNQTSQPIEQVLKGVVTGVKLASNGRQEPWMEGSIEGDFCFGSCGPSQSVSAPAGPNAATIELAFWDSIKASSNAEDFKAYLEEYPNGRFASLARNRLRAQTPAPAAAPAQIALAAPSAQALAPTALAGDLQRMAAGTVFRDCPDCPEMVVIPPGNYLMGGSRSISLPRAYAVGKFEVTFEQWDACVAAGGCTHKPSDARWGRGTRPVMNVSWDDARQYTAWLTKKAGKSYRLLTEAEWEYAARAGTTTAYYWGDGDANICQYANVDNGGMFGASGCGSRRTSPVGERKPNAFGLHDMLGNVWEWTEDCYNAGIDSVPSDGSARTSGDCGERVLRGGSWYGVTGDAYASPYAGSAVRLSSTVGSSVVNTIGFRVARTQ